MKARSSKNKRNMPGQNIGSFQMTAEERERFDRALKDRGFANRPHFLRMVTLQFIKQVESGEYPDWPIRFVMRRDVEIKKAPTKRGRPKGQKKS